MKNLLLITSIFLFSASSSLMANTTPTNDEEEFVLVKSKGVVYTMHSINDARAFSSVTLNNITKMLKIKAMENIAYVEIFNDKGSLEYLMPVGDKVLNIDLMDFEKGTYTVNMKMQEADKRIISSTLTKSF